MSDAPGASRPPPLTGLLETALYVAELSRAERFYGRLFGARTLFGDQRMRALSIAERQVLLLFVKGGSAQPNPSPGGTIPPHDGDGQLHLAFAIPAESLPAWERQLESLGIPIEARVCPPRGGTSLYFRDPDGHLVELATPGLWEIY